MRLPNPWVGVPVAIAAIGGATVGFFVTTASCAPRTCVVPAVAVAVAVGTVAALGVGVVLILALRSLAEYRNGLDRDILTFVDPPAADTERDDADEGSAAAGDVESAGGDTADPGSR